MRPIERLRELHVGLVGLCKAKPHPVGHRSKRKDGWYIKQPDGSWQKEPARRAAHAAPPAATTPRTSGEMDPYYEVDAYHVREDVPVVEVMPYLQLFSRLRNGMNHPDQFRSLEVSPQHVLFRSHGEWFQLSNNGGELMLSRLNDPTFDVDIPTTNMPGGYGSLNAASVAARVAAVLRGEPQDYRNDRAKWFTHQQQRDLVKAKAHPVGHRSKRKDGWYVKQADGSWEKERKGASPSSEPAAAEPRRRRKASATAKPTSAGAPAPSGVDVSWIPKPSRGTKYSKRERSDLWDMLRGDRGSRGRFQPAEEYRQRAEEGLRGLVATAQRMGVGKKFLWEVLPELTDQLSIDVERVWPADVEGTAYKRKYTPIEDAISRGFSVADDYGTFHEEVTGEPRREPLTHDLMQKWWRKRWGRQLKTLDHTLKFWSENMDILDDNTPAGSIQRRIENEYADWEIDDDRGLAVPRTMVEGMSRHVDVHARRRERGLTRTA